jgi:hypothetical protein
MEQKQQSGRLPSDMAINSHAQKKQFAFQGKMNKG